MYFLGLFHIVAADSHALFASLIPGAEGGGEVVFADGSADPFPGGLEGLLGQGHPRQLHLDLREEEEVRRCKIRRIGRMFDHFEPFRGHPFAHYGGGVNRGVVPQEEPLLLAQNWSLLLEMLHEAAQGLDDVLRVDSFAPGDDVGVDEPLRVEEGQDHLLCPAGLSLCLNRAWGSLLEPLFRLLISGGCVVRYSGFVHSNNVLQNRF